MEEAEVKVMVADESHIIRNFHWNFYQKNECVFHFAQRDDPWKSVVWMFLDHWC